MDKWWDEGIIYNIFEHLPSSDLSAKVGDVYFHRDLFADQVAAEVREMDSMWCCFDDLHVDPQREHDSLICTPSANGKFSIKSAWKVINTNMAITKKK